MRARVLLLVDLSNQLYRACHVNSGLEDGTGVFTGGLYGFMMSLSSAIYATGATDVVVTMDAKPYRRSAVYPSYKLLRKDTQDPELKARYETAQPQVLRMLDCVGIPVWCVPGFESDDLIGRAVLTEGHRFTLVVAMSNDADLLQLMGHPNFRIYKDSKRPLVDHHALPVHNGHRLTPEQYVKALALSGTHNEVAGIEGIGPIKSAKAVLDPIEWRRLNAAHADLIARNLSLIRLPHPELGRQRLPRTVKGRFNLRDLYRFASRYDIEVTPRMAESFEQVLN